MSQAALFNLLAAVLLLIGTPLLLWAVFADRARGRRRCPRCWYDLAGLPGLRCPECGRTAPSERALRRTRRRWRWIALASFILLGSAASRALPTGWRESVPTWAILTFWPSDTEMWLNDPWAYARGPSASMLHVLCRRAAEGRVSKRQQSRWLRQVESHFRRKGELGLLGESPDRMALVTIDIRDLIDMERAYSWVERSQHGFAETIINDKIIPCIAMETWRHNGGYTGRIASIGGTLVIHHEESVLEKVALLLRAIRRAKPDAPYTFAAQESVWPDMCSLLGRLDSAHVDLPPPPFTLRQVVEAVGRAASVPIEIDEAELESANLDPDRLVREPLEPGPASAVLSQAGSLVRTVLTHESVGWFIRPGRVVVTTAEIADRAMLLRVYSLSDFLPVPKTIEPYDYELNNRRDYLASTITSTIDADGWAENGGERSYLVEGQNYFVISSTLHNHILIERFLADLRKAGPNWDELLPPP